MNPHQQNKIDISKLTPEEQRLFRLYGKLPTKKDLLQNKLKERKYFDSGDYALSKAGKASDVGVTNVGSRHPVPENIPHATAASNSPPAVSTSPTAPTHAGFGSGSSPMKESSVLHHQTSSDDINQEDESKENKEENAAKAESVTQQSS
ncbi:hypothetical protein KEM55_007231 [Ascosphaera atra]|nr:hypothetical protein KEM55_007231 [Ascosphaera atra]